MDARREQSSLWETEAKAQGRNHSPPTLRVDTQTYSLQMLLTHDTPSQASQASQAVSRRLDLGFLPRLCSFPADRVPWGRENGTTMMQPSSDQANTKTRGCELPGDKTILPQLAHGGHDRRTWRERGLAVKESEKLRRCASRNINSW